MKPETIALVALLGVFVFATMILVIFLVKKNKRDDDKTNNNSEASEDISKLLEAIKDLEEKNTKRAIEQEDRFRKEIEIVRDKTDEHKQTITDKLNDQLEKIQKQLSDNQTENARETGTIKKMVEEEMNKSIAEKFSMAFKPVTENLDKMRQEIFEINEVGTGIKEIKNIFSNIKHTGIVGEVILRDILLNVLPHQLVLEQHSLGDNKKVDYAIRISTKGKELLLPIDSKFPLLTFKAYQSAIDSGIDIEKSAKEFFDAVKKSAKDISSKYIIENVTTAHAVMYLPSEGIFTTVVNNSELFTYLYQELKVIPAGPTTVLAIIQSIADLYKTAQISDKANMIVKMINNFVKDFDRVYEDIQNVQVNLLRAQKAIDKLNTSAQKMKDNISAFGNIERLELLEP